MRWFRKEDDYVYSVPEQSLDFTEACSLLKSRLKKNRVIVGEYFSDLATVEAGLRAEGIEPLPYVIDVPAYREYYASAGYQDRYGEYYPGNIVEKSLEHFICYSLVRPRTGMTVVDIASDNSPLSEIFQRLSGATLYTQDIMYEKGVHGNRIGSSAANIPLKRKSCDALLLTCSLEHFEQDVDRGFFREAERLLEVQGTVVIVPLYLTDKPLCQTDPCSSVPGNVVFDKGIDVHCVENWGNRHARFYSPLTLKQRLLESTKKLRYHVFKVVNLADIQVPVYAQWILVAEKFRS